MCGKSRSGRGGHYGPRNVPRANPLCNVLYKLERREALQKYLFIAVGGALGSIARFWVGSTISGRMGIKFPYGTFVVNLTACLVIGFTLTYMGKRADLSPALRFLIPVGFIGAYSTFSTFEWETLSTLRSGAFLLAGLYTVGSVILGLIAVWAGSWLGEIL
jgi:CrcB protein